MEPPGVKTAVIVGVAASVLAAGAVVARLLMGNPSPRATPPSSGVTGGSPSETSPRSSSEAKYSARMFWALVGENAVALGVSAPPPSSLQMPFPYFDELPSRITLRPGSSFRTAHLRASLATRRESGGGLGQSFRADHLVMTITNLTAHHLAYRLSTQVTDPTRCEAKGAIAHDAIALAPGETIRRTECLAQRGSTVDVTRVEIMEIPALSYHYVSRLTPGLVLYDPRTAEGHVSPRGAPCPQTFSWREIRDGAERGEIAWRDLIDFYARHNCDEYAFFPGYRYRTDAASPLPARPETRP